MLPEYFEVWLAPSIIYHSLAMLHFLSTNCLSVCNLPLGRIPPWEGN